MIAFSAQVRDVRSAEINDVKSHASERLRWPSVLTFLHLHSGHFLVHIRSMNVRTCLTDPPPAFDKHGAQTWGCGQKCINTPQRKHNHADIVDVQSGLRYTVELRGGIT